MAREQLVMDLAGPPSFNADDFIDASANRAARAALARTGDWRGSVMILTGPVASGKTHLAHIWAEAHGASFFAAGHLPESEQLMVADAVVIEDCDDGFSDETALFHRLNEARAAHRPVLLTALRAPAAWPVATPDLASRLRGSEFVEVSPPDDDLIAALFIKHCADRQLVIEAPAFKAALPRVERSYRFVRDCVAALDRETLRLGRPLTRAMLLSVLATEQVTEQDAAS